MEVDSRNRNSGLDAVPADSRLFSLWQMEMLLRGYHVTPRGMLALSLPFGEMEIDGSANAFDDCLVNCFHPLPRRD